MRTAIDRRCTAATGAPANDGEGITSRLEPAPAARRPNPRCVIPVWNLSLDLRALAPDCRLAMCPNRNELEWPDNPRS